MVSDLLVNAHIVDFLKAVPPSTTKYRKNFVSGIADAQNLRGFDKREVTVALACKLDSIVSERSGRVGLEIKTGGISRASRIPLCLLLGEKVYVLKIIKKLVEIEKAADKLWTLRKEINQDINSTFEVSPMLVLASNEDISAHNDFLDDIYAEKGVAVLCGQTLNEIVGKFLSVIEL